MFALPMLKASRKTSVPRRFGFRAARTVGRTGMLWPVLLCLLATLSAHAATPASGTAAAQGQSLLLVLPFENHSGDPTLGWIGEAAPLIFNQRLAAAGFLPISREDRLYALDHLGLPADFQPSRASTIRLAETLDAAYVVIGSFSTNQQRFTADVRVIDTGSLHMSAPIEEQADMKDLLTLLNSLAWRVARQIDPRLKIARSTFIAADGHLPIGVFEDYVRGLIAPDPEDGIRRLSEAVRLDPHYTPALMALGMAYFNDQQYKLAAATLGRLPTDSPRAREADFYRGLSFLRLNNNREAEDAFAFVAQQLPLPAVLNDEGVARSRRGKDGSELFRKAAAADPTDSDYPFNLAIALARLKGYQAALQALQQSLKLQPDDSEAHDFESRLAVMAKAPDPDNTGTAADVGPAGSSPLKLPEERVKHALNEAVFQQLAAEMERAEAASVASLPPAQRASTLTRQGKLYLDKGLVVQAEQEFQAALDADSSNAGAHAGLAVVREKAGDAASARQEAQESLKLKPNVAAYLVLARLDLAGKQVSSASGNVDRALGLQPQNAAALMLKQQISARTQTPPQAPAAAATQPAAKP